MTKYFDDSGNRLTTPEVIEQPTLGGPDGVSTALAGFTPFYGTSAAAPHVAGAAALLLQASGGPGSLTATQVRQALQSTASAHDLDAYHATATTFTPGASAYVTVTGQGDDSNLSSVSTSFFTVSFTAPKGGTLKALNIDLSTAGLRFDPTKGNGFPLTVGAVTGSVSTQVKATLLAGRTGAANARLSLVFADFPAGGTLQFGIDRDFITQGAGGNSADFLAGGVIQAAILPAGAAQNQVVTGSFTNDFAIGVNTAGGSGLINVESAVESLGH